MNTLYAVTIEVSPEAETAWRQWMQSTHVPEVLREPGFLLCRLWKDSAPSHDGWARYAAHYELASPEALQAYLAGSAVQRLRAEGLQRFGPSMRLSRSTFSPVASFTPG